MFVTDRFMERARIINADYLIRVHLLNNDSGQNIGECIRSYVDHAICDKGLPSSKMAAQETV